MNNEEIAAVINNLVSLIYDLYPDEEFIEMYGVDEKIAQAQALVNQL